MTANAEIAWNDLAYGRIKGGITSVATSIELYPGDIQLFLPHWSSGKNLYLPITDNQNNIEIVKVTDIKVKTNKLTVSRGQDGTNAREWYDGAIINHRINAALLTAMIQKEAYREVAYNPNGILSPAYRGEKVFQTDAADCKKRWWKSISGVVWQMITGDQCPPEWTVNSSDIDAYAWRAVCWNPTESEFLAVSYNNGGVIATSPDGATWTVTASATLPGLPNKLVWCDSLGIYVTTSAGDVYTSSDGETWAKVYDATDGFATCKSLRWFEDQGILLVSISDGGSQYVLYSTDGTNFTSISLDVWDIAYASNLGIFLGIDYGTTTYVSTDGLNWTSQTGDTEADFLSLVASDDLFVCGAGGGAIYVTTDGLTWIEGTLDTSVTPNQIVYTGKYFILQNNFSGVTEYSDDGLNWTDSLIDGNRWYGLCYSPDLVMLVTVADNGDDRSAVGDL